MLREGEKLRVSQGRGYRGNLCTSLSILLASKSALKNRALVSVKVKGSLSHVQLCVTPWTTQPTGLLCPWSFLGKNTGVGCHSLLQGIFLPQGLNPGLWHCRQILYRLSHQGSPSQCIGKHLSTSSGL